MKIYDENQGTVNVSREKVEVKCKEKARNYFIMTINSDHPQSDIEVDFNWCIFCAPREE